MKILILAISSILSIPTLTVALLLLNHCPIFSNTISDDTPSSVEVISIESTPLFKNVNDTRWQVVLFSLKVNEDLESLTLILKDEHGVFAEKSVYRVDSGEHRFEMDIEPVQTSRDVQAEVKTGDLGITQTITLTPERQWKIYIMPGTHFDYGYTDIQPETMRVHRENLEKAIDWAAKYPDFVWNLEASLVAQDYMKHGFQPSELIRLGREGRIGVQGFLANPLTGISSGEELSRLIGQYDHLRHTYGIQSRIATQNDVPTMVWTIPMILNEHGIKYLSHGQNRVRVGPHQAYDKKPYYWQSPDGSRVLSWKVVGSYSQSQWLTGPHDEGDIDFTRMMTIRTVRDFTRFGDYPYDAVLVHGAFGDNRPIRKSLAQIPDEWNRTYEWPKLILSRGTEFFEYIEENFSEHIPTYTGCGGVYWEDGAGSSAFETALTRNAREELITAEKLASFASPRFQRWMNQRLWEAWQNIILYHEHTWGADISVQEPFADQTTQQWAFKKSFADEAAEMSSKLLESAADWMVEDIRVNHDSVVVFNSTSWERSGTIDFACSDGEQMSLHVESVPPLGYVTVPVSNAQPFSSRKVPGKSLENIYYRIEFNPDTGAITSIYDKELGRELLDTSSFGANAHLYVTNFYKDDEDLIIQTTANAKLQKVTKPGRQVMQVTSDAPMASSFASEVVLYNNEKRIDFINHLDKIANLEKESGYFAFPFAFENPDVRVEIPHGVMRPEIDQFTGACRDWYAIQHFLTLSDENAAIVWSALDSPLVTLQDINREKFMHHIEINNGYIFGYVFNNLWFTNYRAAQEGPLTFRFSMKSANTVTDLEAKRFGESVHSPLVARFVESRPAGADKTKNSLIILEAEGTIIQAVKPARFHNGVVVRLREMNGDGETVTLIPDGVEYSRAFLSNMGEDKHEELPVNNGAINVPCRALGVTTVLLER